MDELLQRLVEVDRLADDKLRQANDEAERLVEDYRRQLAQEDQAFDDTLSGECARVLQEDLAASQREREQALAQADDKMQADLKAFTQHCAQKREAVLQALLFAEAVPGGDKAVTEHT